MTEERDGHTLDPSPRYAQLGLKSLNSEIIHNVKEKHRLVPYV